MAKRKRDRKWSGQHVTHFVQDESYLLLDFVSSDGTVEGGHVEENEATRRAGRHRFATGHATVMDETETGDYQPRCTECDWPVEGALDGTP